MIDLGDIQTNENENTLKSKFQSLKDFLCENENDASPDEYIKNCRLEYEREQKEFINRKIIKSEDISSVKRFVEDYRQFIFLDWQNLVLKLIAANNKSVFYLFVFMKQENILTSEDLKESLAFQKYQDLISDKEKLREFFENDSALKITNFSASAEWQMVEEKGKIIYVLAVECGDYVCEAESDEKKSVLDVATEVLLLDGLSFKCALDNDETIYLEVPNV